MLTKYRNKKVVVDGRRFDSVKESERYKQLRLMERAGVISGLEPQKRFLVIPKQKGERAAYYVADFVYTENGKMIIEDVKSPPTRKRADYILKRKLVKLKYPDAEFREV